ncbi:MAG TPA: glycosyltransferase family 4 protein [Lunatimonas sp.]|nr:glycosyltransferase family 4 protein [Lunatimonas sp.]
MMKKVTIIYRTIPQYRIEFYNQLKIFLNERNIRLQLIYGNNGFCGRNDSVDIEWATYIENKSVSIGPLTLIWQPNLHLIKDSDLVIVEQANMLLINYLLILKRRLFNKKFAFWGHGQDFQAPKDSLLNKFKMTYINQSSWWFPYTEGVKKFLIEKGVDDDKITVVQNAIDTKTLRAQYLSFSDEEINECKAELGIKKGEKVLIYCGALSKDKNLPFIFESAKRLGTLTSTKFKLLILGNGPKRKMVEDFAQQSDYVIYVGPKFGLEKSKYFRISDILIMPGAMGLAVLDAFTFETPIVTIEYPYHGPEIEYIRNYENGIIAKDDVDDFNSKVVELMENENLYNLLKANGLDSINTLNIENMVSNFGNGIIDCLNKPTRQNENSNLLVSGWSSIRSAIKRIYSSFSN